MVIYLYNFQKGVFMKKKIVLSLLIVSILVFMLAVTANAEWIDGIDYTLNSNGTATVSATNRTECKITVVNIPSTVKAANGQTYTVTALADRCFGHQDAGAGNQYVETVYVPSTVTYLGGQLFRNCSAIKKIVIDAQVTGLPDGTFWSCPNLEELDLSGMTSLTSIANIASGNGKLKTAKLPSSLVTIGSKAFQSCALTSIVIPNGVTSIGSNCFQANKLTKVVIPESVTSIGGAAFHSNSTLKTVVFANPDLSGYSTNVPFTSSPVTLVFYAGENADAVKTQFSQFKNFTAVSYEDYLKNPNAEYKSTIVYGTKNCECGELANNDVKFQFTDYLSGMQDAISCSCGKTTVVENYDPIMTFVGYSAKINGDRICVGYTINKQSVDVYKAKTGKTLTFGVTAAIVADGTTQHQTVNSDLTAVNDKTVVAQIDGMYAGFDFVISGFTSDYYEKSLVIGAFVYDGTKIIYVDFGGCNDYATPFTFNSVAQ